MKKKLIVIFLLITTLLFSSCSLGGLIYDDSREKGDERLEKVLEATTNKDKDALRAMFSETALSETEDIDGRMEYLFDFFQGKVIYREFGGATGGGEHSYGHVTEEYRSWYTVDTDKEKYFIFMVECTADTDHPDNVGLYMLQVIKAEDEDTQFDGGRETLCAGIYMPTEEEESIEPEDDAIEPDKKDAPSSQK